MNICKALKNINMLCLKASYVHVSFFDVVCDLFVTAGTVLGSRAGTTDVWPQLY